MPLPRLSSWVITDSTICSPFSFLKSTESRSVENVAIFRSAKYAGTCSGCCRYGKRKNGAIGTPAAIIYCAKAHFDFFFGLFEVSGVGLPG